MSSPSSASSEFERLVKNEEPVDLEQVALEVAADIYPGLDTSKYIMRLDELADRLRPRILGQPSMPGLIRQINWVLYVEDGFRGNEEDYFDPRNSHLNQVLDRRVGIPISLAIVYRGVARRVGLNLAGVNLPAHFVLRSIEPDAELFIDAFDGGRILDRDGCRQLLTRRLGYRPDLDESSFAPCSNRAIVARMLRNLRAIYGETQDFPRLECVLRRLIQLEPTEMRLKHDLAMAQIGQGKPGAAIPLLEEYLTLGPYGDDHDHIRQVMKRLQREVAERN